MASEEWSALEPAAAVQISDALARQATVSYISSISPLYLPYISPISPMPSRGRPPSSSRCCARTSPSRLGLGPGLGMLGLGLGLAPD